MTRRMRLGLAALFLLSLVAAVPASADRTMETGIEDNTQLFNPSLANSVVPQWKALGVDVVRVAARWNRLAPAAASPVKPAGFNSANPNDSHYNWTELDAGLAKLQANGLGAQILIPLSGPLWASERPSLKIPEYKPKATEFANFATAVAQRYRGKVRRLLVGNEPNQRFFLQPQLQCSGRKCVDYSPYHYRKMLTAAIPKMRRAAPGVKLIIGELAPIGSTVRNKNSSLKPLAFLRGLGCVDKRFKPIRTGLCRGFKPVPRADGFGFHPYQVKAAPNARQRDPDLVKLGDLPKLFSTLDLMTRQRRLFSSTGKFNLYLTEFGYETNPPDRSNGVSAALQARYLQQGWYIAWSTARVKSISQYVWRDEPLKREGPGRRAYGGFQSGLLFEDNTPKPSLAVFPNPFFIDVRAKIFWGQIRPGGGHRLTIKRETSAGSGNFATVSSVLTDSRGYWKRKLTPRRRSNYVYEYATSTGVARSAIVHVP